LFCFDENWFYGISFLFNFLFHYLYFFGMLLFLF
jgi:hypothetical protein